MPYCFIKSKLGSTGQQLSQCVSILALSTNSKQTLHQASGQISWMQDPFKLSPKTVKASTLLADRFLPPPASILPVIGSNYLSTFALFLSYDFLIDHF